MQNTCTINIYSKYKARPPANRTAYTDTLSVSAPVTLTGSMPLIYEFDLDIPQTQTHTQTHRHSQDIRWGGGR